MEKNDIKKAYLLSLSRQARKAYTKSYKGWRYIWRKDLIYKFQETEKGSGKYIALNREYKPVGISGEWGEWLDYKMFHKSHAVKLDRAKLEHIAEGMGCGFGYMWMDSSRPDTLKSTRQVLANLEYVLQDDGRPPLEFYAGYKKTGKF